MISDGLAKLIFPNEDPVGKHAILWKGQASLDAVVGDICERGLASSPTLPVYLPYGRYALTTGFVVHTRGTPRALIGIDSSLMKGAAAWQPIRGE